MTAPTDISNLQEFATDLLQQLIAIPSLSGQEDETADLLFKVLGDRHVMVSRVGNNVWASTRNFDSALPVVLLNSHHDTVAPNQGYTVDPYHATIRENKLFGLGANDAGGPLVCLLAAFLHFHDKQLPFNLVFAASAEEEVSGKNGIELLLPHLPRVDMAIVGEPTGMNIAVAEKGLLVLDCVAKGKAGHAARDEGVNALYKAIDDISRLRHHRFEKVSDLLGAVHISVTSIETPNKAHNVVPDQCAFVADIRVNEQYTFEEILASLRSMLSCDIQPRSLRLRPSFISPDHPLVQAGLLCGMSVYGSPTLSDMALMNFPAIKLGPGDSSRSHTADEFIFVDEIASGISGYIELIGHLCKTIKN